MKGPAHSSTLLARTLNDFPVRVSVISAPFTFPLECVSVSVSVSVCGERERLELLFLF